MEPLDRPWDQKPWTKRPRHSTKETPVTSIQQRSPPVRRQVHAEVPGAGRGAGDLRGLDLRGVLRRRTQGRLQEKLAVRRPDRAAAEARGRSSPANCRESRVDRHHARSGRQRVRVPQRMRASRQQGRLAGAPQGRALGQLPRSSPASTTAGATASRVGSPTSPTRASSSTSKSQLQMPPVHCEDLAGFIFVNLAKDPVSRCA